MNGAPGTRDSVRAMRHVWVVAVFLMTSAMPVLAETSFVHETVDASENVGEFSSLALDAQGEPHISYRDGANGRLKYAEKNGGTWTVETVDVAGDAGIFTSLALDAQGDPHISYYTNLSNVRYAVKNGGVWALETVTTVISGFHTSLALDTQGNPHISYYDGFFAGAQDLMYATKDGGVWTLETADASPSPTGGYGSLALDAQGNPRISYYDFGDNDLRYAAKNGGTWTVEIVDDVGDVGYSTSLALNDQDEPRISYRDATTPSLKYAMKEGGMWSSETVDDAGDVDGTSLALDVQGNPRISYYDFSNGILKYAVKDGGAWTTCVVDDSGQSGAFNSLALNADDSPRISYHDGTNNNLEYARAIIRPPDASPPTTCRARITDIDFFDSLVCNRTYQDTTWCGDVDVNGQAVLGGIWDFSNGTLQGWTSTDRTAHDVFFRRITPADCAAGLDPVCGVITAGGSTASMWVGAHENEAAARGWPGGMGYSNGWGMNMLKTFTYDGSGDITISFDYFVDSETRCDFVYLYVMDANGVYGPLNRSANPNTKWLGYSGSNQEQTAIGSPGSPAHDDINQAPMTVAEEFDVWFRFESDPFFSDGLDEFAGILNSQNGAFGVDNVRVLAGGLSQLDDFESGTDGWVTFADPAIGSFLSVAHLLDLDPITDPCFCPLSGFVMLAADLSPVSFPHPINQHEWLVSPPCYVGPGSPVADFQGVGAEYDVFADLPVWNGVGYRTGVHFYPWTSPETGVVGWSREPVWQPVYRFSDLCDRKCSSILEEFCGVPESGSLDSLRLVFELVSDCQDFGVHPGNCTGPDQSGQSPYWDNIRIGFFRGAEESAALTPRLLFQDAFPEENSLLPSATAEINAFGDLNFADGDETNAVLGDSAVVCVTCGPNTEVYLNFRVKPGPDQDVADPWFVKHGPSLHPNWARARMDTAEMSLWIADCHYATYVHENDPTFIAPEIVIDRPNPNNEILPDDLFVPGTVIEYFFSGSVNLPFADSTCPDTTDGNWYEVSVLPGYRQIADELVSACVLYVDAAEEEAQELIETYGLRPYLGSSVDDDGRVRDNWDRYDYLAAVTNCPAPMAREATGNNGMTRYQSMMYRTVLYNTGTHHTEGLRDGDAYLLENWLASDDFARWDFQKGLWLSGHGISTIMNNPTRPNAMNLMVNFATATLEEECYIATGDSSFCVRLDPTTPRDFPFSSSSYAAIRGMGCPIYSRVNVINALTGNGGVGNLEYVDQDNFEIATQFAAVSNDQFATGGNPANYGVVLDAFSLHTMRRVPDGWTGTSCGNDPSAITQRTNDVFDWLQASTSLCDPALIIVGTPEGTAVPSAIRTGLAQNAPNPFNPRTTVRYQVEQTTTVQIRVHDVQGRVVRTLVDGVVNPGAHAVVWDGMTSQGIEASSGIYWARMTTSDGYRGSTKMVIVK